jgi:hypothetical protein
MIWFVVQAVALLFVPAINVALARFRIKPDMLNPPNIIAIEFGIVLLVLFFSGMTAWSREHEKSQDKWPHLDARQIERISNSLTLNVRLPISIHSNDSSDCLDLSAQVHDAIRGAGCDVGFADSSRRWSPGITIAVRLPDERALALQKALAVNIGTEVHMATSDRLEPHILIGSSRMQKN